jgi:polysaccharide biosynthesis/export protein
MRLSIVTPVLSLGILAAQTTTRPQNPYGPMSEVGTANLPVQKIGVNDLIAISVYDAPELTRTVRVGGEGFVRLPLLKQRIKAEGLLPSELEDQLAAELTKEEMLVNPVVSVTVVEYHSRPVSVVGAVKKPLTFQAVGRTTLLDALAKAEGLSEFAGSEIILTQTQKPGQPEVMRIPVRQLIDQAKPELNVLLDGGEEIRVPEAKKLFVLGNVKKPGAFPVKEEADTSLLKALAMAEGLMPFASKTAYVYRPDAKTGQKQEIPVMLQEILNRKQPDVSLLADDILYIPDNKGKRLTVETLEKAANFGAVTLSGVLIWKH